MSYQTRQRNLTRNKTLLGVLILGSVIAVIAGIFYLKWYLDKNQENINQETLCPVSGSPEYIAVIFDKSDSYNSIQQTYLENYFNVFTNRLPVGSQISLYVIDDKQIQNMRGQDKEIAPELTICKPRTGQNANVLYENPELIHEIWKEKFETPLNNAIVAYMKPSTAKTSPIMEMLQIVSLTAFPTGSDGHPKKIIIISDMLHHTDEWSHYRGQLSFAALKETEYYQRVNTNLHGAEVEVLYVRRDGMAKTQTRRHALFWEEYINSIGGKAKQIQKIDG